VQWLVRQGVAVWVELEENRVTPRRVGNLRYARGQSIIFVKQVVYDDGILRIPSRLWLAKQENARVVVHSPSHERDGAFV